MEKGKIYKLWEICSIRSGKTPSTKISEYWKNDEVPWYTQTDITSQSLTPQKFITKKAVKECKLPLTTKNTVLLCNVSEVTAFLPNIPNLTCNQQVFLLEPKLDKINPNYLYYLLCSWKNKLNFLMRGTIFKSLTKTELENFPIPLPSLSQQNEILTKFQIVYNNLFQSEVIYQDFLLQLIQKYLKLGDLLFLKYQDSKIKIKDHFQLIRGKTPPTNKPEYYQNGTIKWINSGVLTNLYFLTEYTPASKLISESAVKECQLSYAWSNSVLLSGIDFNINDKIVWNQTSNNFLLGTGIYGFASEKQIEKATFFFALRSSRQEIIQKLCLSGATQFTSLRSSELLDFSLFWVSNPAHQKIFFTILNSSLAKIKDLHRKIKDLLLLKYFSNQ